MTAAFPQPSKVHLASSLFLGPSGRSVPVLACQGSVVLWVWLVSDVVRDDMEPAPASGIMWSQRLIAATDTRACRAIIRDLAMAAALRFHSRDPFDPWRPSGSASGWASLYGFPAAMLKLGLTQRPATGGLLRSKEAERMPRRRCPGRASLSIQAIVMDHGLEWRALVHSDAGW